MADDDFDESPYSRLVGERLRVIRRQKKLSLNDVEAQTNDEFRISVPRLERLARFYGVSIDQLLPRDPLAVERNQPGATGPTKIRIDVAKLSTYPEEKFRMLERFLRMIQVQRQDFNGKVITVRAHDTRAIAVMLDVPVDEVADQLRALGLIFVPPTA
jgi:transcriptional regulator with XRE-family HTH domain